MFFQNNIEDWGNAVLKHNSGNIDLYLQIAEFRLHRDKTDEDNVKKFTNEYRLIFCNHFVETSHFINFINANRIAKKQKEDFFYYLLIYIKQFYSDIDFLKNINDVSSLTALFDKCYKKIDSLLSESLDNSNLECVKRNTELINRIFKFYGIIEDFMIRFYSYSIVGISGQKHIITACNNCDKKFIDYLMQGYSLFRLQKICLVNNHDNDAKQHYEFFPVLPTKDVGFPIDEYIEILDSDSKIENKRLVKMLKLQ